MLIEPEDDGEEHFVDAAETGENAKPAQANGTAAPKSLEQAYDGRKRDPQYANADSTCLWELVRSSYTL